jgi:hypothetical protein
MTTPKGLRTLAGAQASAHLTFNEDVVLLENGVGALSVLDRGLTTPASLTPSEGDVYILAGTSGDWGTATNKVPATGDIAVYQNGGWIFYTPASGTLAYIEDEKLWLGYSQDAWHLFLDDWPTTETWTGKYIGSEKIYRKRVDCGAGPNATTKTVAHGTGMTADTPLRAFGWMGTTTGTVIAFPLPIAQLGGLGPIVVEFTVQATNIVLRANTNVSIFNVYIDLEYSK